MTIARDERAALVTTLRAVGPDAPTLCEGWTARDLTAHMIVREYRLDASPGILISAFAGHTKSVQDKAAEADWDSMLAKFAAGPPLYSPMKLVDRFVNITEYFVHHEDVRRAAGAWEPRTVSAEANKAILRTLKPMAKRVISKSPATVELVTPDGEQVATGGTGPSVRVVGEPLELLLFSFGRAQTRLDFEGDADAVAAVKAAKRGF
ncbi:TIGR03085 family metal-binding protein [Nocardia sp. 348MFTsu5.1]|uniref:TIGR03085 family metal-binding protein n=1 Tax=Nocardia sp. 348MFTsu5.1 TaxID=1172185 RepID=UPI000377F255|nr:TIGR03085 family metal-binding protein [Nocardia sp. 348MFTsu5.1]